MVPPLCKRSRKNGQCLLQNVLNNASNDQRPTSSPIVIRFPKSSPFYVNAPASLNLPVVPDVPQTTTSVETNRNQNAIKYYSPSEKDIVSYCRDLELDFDRKLFHEFHSQINFETITPDSKPNRIYAINDTSGFGCFSVFFTGTESSAKKIRNKIFNKFVNFLNPAENSSNEKLQQILNSNSMTDEHLETLVKWFKFRIVVYSNENGWEKYGDWNSENDPIFVL